LGPLQPLLLWEQGDRGFTLQSAAVAEPEVNALVNSAMLRGNLLARGNFDSLPIPFRAVATDLANRSPVVLASGDLARSVRASFAIPLIFAPESLDGRILADGGLAANIPITVARAAGAERVIVSDATERLADSLDLYSPLVLADRLLGFLFQQPGDTLIPGDVLVRPAVEGFTSLNFSSENVAALIRHGTVAAESTLSRIPCLPKGAPPATRPLPHLIAGYRIESRNYSERLALVRLLGLDVTDSLDFGLLRSRVRQLGQAEAYQSVWLSPRGGGDSVSFQVSIRRSPRRVAGLGVAYDSELGGRLWLGAVERRTLNLALETGAAVFLGEFRKHLYLNARRNYQLGRQLMKPTVTIKLGTESVRQFDAEGDELAEIKTREAFGFAALEREFGQEWQAGVGMVAHAWHEPQINRSTLGALLRISHDDRSGVRLGEASFLWTGVYHRIEARAEAHAKVGRLRLRPNVRIGWGENLPIQAGFPLGGDDGFPGLHLGERRGDRELVMDVLATYQVDGPLVARLELAVGRSANGGPLVNKVGWITGSRIGLGAETPVGPVRIEYGLADNGRGTFFLRLGRWF
jgi:NTE family protein